MLHLLHGISDKLHETLKQEVPEVEDDSVVESDALRRFHAALRNDFDTVSALAVMDAVSRELLQARPEDEAIRLQLEQLQDALARRIEINLEFDYLYAAAVYLELFRQADGAPETVRQLSRRLGAQRATRTE